MPSANRQVVTIAIIAGKLKKPLRWLGIAAAAVAGLTLVLIGIAVWLWQQRPDLSELNWPTAETSVDTADAVTATWFGVTTVLFDDGETQVLIDGFFTRIRAADYLTRNFSSDIATINYALAEYRINRLAAIIPTHSHFDHAMDAGIVANRGSAVVLGSESTANIARGAALPVNQYQILADRESRQFGDFTITLIVSRHAPLADGERTWFPGKITEPLTQPARLGDWKAGESYSVVIGHPRGTTLVQSSGGYIEQNLSEVAADVVMLGVGGLARLGRDYAEKYWDETVTMTGADRVFPMHYDDFSKPFGEVALFPRIADDAPLAASWISRAAAYAENPPRIERLPFGERVVLY